LRIVAAIVIGVVAAVALGLLLFDVNWLRGWLAGQASAALGREVMLGDLEVDWSWTPRVSVDGVEIANAESGSRPDMVTIDRLEFTVALAELLRGRLVLPELSVSRPDVLLETHRDGSGNWQLPGATDAGGPATLPTIGALKLENAALAYVAGDVALEATVTTLVGQSDERQLRLSAEGEFEDTAMRLKLVTGAMPKLQQGDARYPVDLDLSFGDTEIAISGTVALPLERAAADLAIAIKGPDLAALALADGLPIPSTPPYALSGSLVRAGETWRLEQFKAQLGGSDVGGTLAIDLSAAPPSVDADLVADVLDVGELLDIFGLPPVAEIPEAAAADDGLIVPNDALDPAPLRAIDGHVALQVRQLLMPILPLDNLILDLTLEGALLRVQPLQFGIGGGELRTFLSLYGDKEPPGIDLLTYVRDVPLRSLFRDTQFVDEAGGKIDGRIKVAGRGRTLHEALAAADGEMNLVMHGGQISGLIVELIGLDVAEALALYVGEDTAVPIRCLVVDTTVASGILKYRTLLLDTEDTLITGAGQLDLGTETVDLKLTPEPKDLTVLSLRSEVSIEGRLADLSAAPDVASLLRMLPPIDLGTAEDAPCEQLLERARQEVD
jgi:uncharacterized protein involved in outer membrane biogenesis